MDKTLPVLPNVPRPTMPEEHSQSLSLSNLLRPEIRANPYPLYRQIRSADPVHWDEPLGFWVLTRYADMVSALHDPRFSKAQGLSAALNRLPEAEREQAQPVYRAFSQQMLYADPPYHTRLGIHFCLGAPLARLEGQIAIMTVLRRLPTLRLEAEALEWQENPTFRGVKALPIAFPSTLEGVG